MIPPPILRALAVALGLAAFAAAGLHAATPSLLPDRSAYFPGEDIVVAFAGGPGNPKDWIGVYPVDVEPGSQASTIWRYVDGTGEGGGNVGLKEGTITFPGGLTLGGDWVAYFLLNDGYTKLATNRFTVVDPSTPLVRLDRRLYTTGQPVVATFTNGPANARDWIGIYKEGQTPGAAGIISTLFLYVDGTATGSAGRSDGAVSFAGGLTGAGNYVAYFLLNDGYDILAQESFTVTPPAPAAPRLLSLNPASDSSNLPPLLQFSATITNGTSRVATNTVTLRLDGTQVPATVTLQNDLVTVTYTNDTLPAAGSTHTWLLTSLDDAVPPNELRAESTFTIGTYRDIVLPAPIYFENFDGIAEGSLPPGWTGETYTEVLNPEADFGNLDSAAYAGWTVVNAERFRGSFVTYSNPDNSQAEKDDYHRVLSVNPFNVLNGRVYAEPLAKGRFLFANSGYRNGASQVLFLTTAPFNLSSHTNLHLSFKSLWEQNQDSIAAIEYSVDQGTNWLPIAYFIAGPDIVTVTNEVSGEVTVDAEATFTTEHGDVARYFDNEGGERGGTYGAFIAAPVSGALAPYIQARVDDNPVESKRIELFPLPAADLQADVRFRFAHAGTDSWYFGLDDFGLYSLGAVAAPPSLTVTRDGPDLVIAWPASTGSTLETSPTLGPVNWQAVPGVSGISHRVTPVGAAAYYRLRQ